MLARARPPLASHAPRAGLASHALRAGLASHALRAAPRRVLVALLALAACVAVTACGSPKKKAAAVPAGAATCTPAKLPTLVPGRLTVATDSPAYPPYFEDNRPADGKGFESAVAYGVARRLGYTPAQVHWVVEPFDSSYAPGPKSFDFDINEISITPQRAKAVDFSVPYYTNPQGIIVPASSRFAHATSLAALRGVKFGVQIGTTSLEAVDQAIKPTQQPQVFNTSGDVTEAFKNGSVQAIVTDLATVFDITSTELSHTAIVGQFSAPGGDNWGLLLAKSSPLTPCVDRAVSALKANGTLAALSQRWIASAASVPVLR